jgi:CHAD domain-containing protein
MKRRYVLDPEGRAGESVRAILRSLLDVLESKVDGVVEDTGVDFLHDLRVANRRTRTVLSQMRGVLPGSRVAVFSPGFKWLSVVTGPHRDLDVTLLEMAGFRGRTGIDEPTFDLLQHILEDKRRAEHDRVSAALRSTGFRLLLEGWRDFLESESEESHHSPLASTPIIEIAGPRILKAAKRIRKRGATISPDASAALLHRLRIDGKKLRYLLEFFFVLYDSAAVSRSIDELKRFQDTLGEFNDTEVQLALIREFSDETCFPAAELDVIDRLTNEITERQRALRIDAVDRYAAFASDDSRRLYNKMFKAR